MMLLLFPDLFRRASTRTGAPIAVLILFIGWPSAHAAEPRGWDLEPQILQHIISPTFPDRDFDVTKEGAVGDGVTDSRPGIMKAIEACADAGGGRVVVPAGRYLVNGPIHLKSGVNLFLAEGAIVTFGIHPDDYLVGDAAHQGCVPTKWEGTRCYNYSPLIYAYRQHNIAVTGKGVLDAQTTAMWADWKKKQKTDQNAIRVMNHTGVPIEQRIFSKGHFLRPTFFEPYECEGVLIEGVTLKASPFWTIHPLVCTNVTVRNVTVTPGTTNDDGCDPESCTDVLVEGCNFSTVDDNIAIKAGRDNDAWPENGGRSCSNIVIRKCIFTKGSPGGVSIGSEMSGSVRNVFVEDCTMPQVRYAIYLKGNGDRGGAIQGVWARNINIAECKTVLKTEMTYSGVKTGKYLPDFSEIHVDHVSCTRATQSAFEIRGMAGHLVKDVTISDVNVASAPIGMISEYAQGLHLTNVQVAGKTVMAGGK
jgi:polygalacturonase